MITLRKEFTKDMIEKIVNTLNIIEETTLSVYFFKYKLT